MEGRSGSPHLGGETSGSDPAQPKGETVLTPYDRLGGEAGLRAIVDDFVERVTSDMMIGFLFRKVDKQRLKELEFQFASRHLGGPHRYEGRSLPDAHRAHPIMGGQFNRRLRLLDKTLQDHQAAPEVRTLWLSHNEKLRSQITRDAPDECAAPSAPPDLKPEQGRDNKDR